MDNEIKINGQTASGEPLHWLMQQDLSFLQNYIASSVLSSIIEQGKSFNTTPAATEAQNLYVLLNFLRCLQEVKESRVGA